MTASWPAERIVAPMASDQERAQWFQLGWREGYADGFRDVIDILALGGAPDPEPPEDDDDPAS